MADDGANITTVVNQLNSLTNMKIVSNSFQSITNACSGNGKRDCTHMCIGTPNGHFKCLCPDNYEMNEYGACQRMANFTADTDANAKKCDGKTILCNSMCAPAIWRCGTHIVISFLSFFLAE